MRSTLFYFCCLLAVLAANTAMGSPSVSPSEEVQLNFQQLIETNSCPGCNLAGAVLNRIDLSGADLAGANLAGAQLYLASLAGANLQNANLQGAGLGGADLAGADLRGANLTGAVIEGAYLVGALMDGKVTVRRPYLDEGGPEAGETVYVDDEASSKNLPFTDTAHVAEGEETKTAGPGVESAAMDDAESTGEKPVQAAEEETVPDEAGQLIDEAAPQESMPEESKKLVMMADAVVPQNSLEDEETVSAAPQEEMTEPLPGEGEPVVAVEEASPEPSGEMEAAEQEIPVESMTEVQQEPASPPAGEENIEAVPPVAVEPQTASGTGDMDRDTSAMLEAPEESSSTGDAVRSEQVILDKDAIVAEAAPPDALNPPRESVEEEPQAEEEYSPGGESAAMEPQVPLQMNPLPEEEAGPAEQEREPQVDDSAVMAETVQAQQVPEQESVQEETAVSADEQKLKLVEVLLDENRCVGCDLSGMDLSGRDLGEADLERADLRGANLNGADLSEANLKGADLRGADLRKADLREADLYRANLDEADLTGARFEEALLDMVSSSGAIGADFTGALTGE